MSEIQRIVLEDTIDQGITWSPLWTGAEVHHYLNQRISRFLLETEMVQGYTQIAVGLAAATVDLPSDLIVLKRLGATGSSASASATVKRLVPVDRWQSDLVSFAALDANDRAMAFIQEPKAPLTVTVLPTPVGSTAYECLYVAEATTFTTGSSRSSAFPLPDMFSPYIMMGVLEDMFSKEGEANDPDRAKYFGERWDEGIEIGKLLLR